MSTLPNRSACRPAAPGLCSFPCRRRPAGVLPACHPRDPLSSGRCPGLLLLESPAPGPELKRSLLPWPFQAFGRRPPSRGWGCTPAPGCLQGPDPKFRGPPPTARPRLCAPHLQASGAQVGPAPTVSLSKVRRSRLLRHPRTRSLRPFGWGSTSRAPCTTFWRRHVGSNLRVAPSSHGRAPPSSLAAAQAGEPRSVRRRRKRRGQPGPPGGQGLVGAPWGGRGLVQAAGGGWGGHPGAAAAAAADPPLAGWACVAGSLQPFPEPGLPPPGPHAP